MTNKDRQAVSELIEEVAGLFADLSDKMKYLQVYIESDDDDDDDYDDDLKQTAEFLI